MWQLPSILSMSLIKPLIWNELDHQGNQFFPCILYSITFGIRERALSEILNIYHLALHQNDTCFDSKYETVVTIRNNDKKTLIHELNNNIIKFENRLGRICWNPEGLWSTRNLVDTADSTHNSHPFENFLLSKITSFISMKKLEILLFRFTNFNAWSQFCCFTSNFPWRSE